LFCYFDSEPLTSWKVLLLLTCHPDSSLLLIFYCYHDKLQTLQLKTICLLFHSSVNHKSEWFSEFLCLRSPKTKIKLGSYLEALGKNQPSELSKLMHNSVTNGYITRGLMFFLSAVRWRPFSLPEAILFLWFMTSLVQL
jgi:hypothetical protein